MSSDCCCSCCCVDSTGDLLTSLYTSSAFSLAGFLFIGGLCKTLYISLTSCCLRMFLGLSTALYISSDFGIGKGGLSSSISEYSPSSLGSCDSLSPAAKPSPRLGRSRIRGSVCVNIFCAVSVVAYSIGSLNASSLPRAIRDDVQPSTES